MMMMIMTIRSGMLKTICLSFYLDCFIKMFSITMVQHRMPFLGGEILFLFKNVFCASLKCQITILFKHRKVSFTPKVDIMYLYSSTVISLVYHLCIVIPHLLCIFVVCSLSLRMKIRFLICTCFILNYRLLVKCLL